MLPRVALVKSEVNSTIPEPLLGFVDSFNGADRFRSISFIHSKDEAFGSFEGGEIPALVRIGQNLSTYPHYRLLCKTATSSGEDSTLDIELDTNNQEIRFVFQRELIGSFEVSMSGIGQILSFSPAMSNSTV